MSAKAIFLPLLLAMFLGTLSARAADTPARGVGSVAGTVKDAAGAILQGAQITLQPTATTAATDGQGNFVVSDLKPGTYTATISYVGFTTSTNTVVIKPWASTTLNVILELVS
jgi:hypothetical protein